MACSRPRATRAHTSRSSTPSRRASSNGSSGTSADDSAGVASEKLSLVPHAFEGRNAYFDPTRKAVLFGYYRADLKDPGANLPGQMIFTCLSSDIIAHEVTHALVHRLRRHFSVATNPDVFAWHEAFADLIALFQHFAYRGRRPRRDRVDVRKHPKGRRPIRSRLGVRAVHGARRGAAPRDRSQHAQPNCCAHLSDTTPPPNLMNAARASSVRCSTPTWIAIKPPSPTCFDWRRAARADSRAAGCIPTWWPASPPKPSGPQTDSSGMVVRAFDYLPPVDVTFGDVVQAIVTSDHSLYPTDRLGLRGNLIEALRRRGIYPTRAISLTDRALIWPRPDGPLSFSDGNPPVPLEELVLEASMNLDPASTPGAKPERVFSALNRLGQKRMPWPSASSRHMPIAPGERPRRLSAGRRLPTPSRDRRAVHATPPGPGRSRAAPPAARCAHSLAGRHHVDRPGGRRNPAHHLQAASADRSG